MCWQFEEDLVQFWCGNMVKLAAMILCIGYLTYGIDFGIVLCDYTICCFQKYFFMIEYLAKF